MFNTMVHVDISIEDNIAKGVVIDSGETDYADRIVSGVGREGADWFAHICSEHGIETNVGTVDVGCKG